MAGGEVSGPMPLPSTSTGAGVLHFFVPLSNVDCSRPWFWFSQKAYSLPLWSVPTAGPGGSH
jgi:hypothetical protein